MGFHTAMKRSASRERCWDLAKARGSYLGLFGIPQVVNLQMVEGGLVEFIGGR